MLEISVLNVSYKFYQAKFILNKIECIIKTEIKIQLCDFVNIILVV